MNEMIERVAEAIRGCDPSAGASYEAAARAAIEAMREPNAIQMDAAIKATRDPLGNMRESFGISARDARGCWQAMIDAALS